MRPRWSRRAFLLSSAVLPWCAPKQAGAKTRLILLGTGGGPRPKKGNAATAQVIIVDDRLYVVDCGDGVLLSVERHRPTAADLLSPETRATVHVPLASIMLFHPETGARL